MGAGEGPPVVLIHGFGADLNTWMFTQPALAEGRRAVAFDLPGHGGSVKEVGAGDLECVDRRRVGALDALGIDRAHLVGHSMGGAIVAAFALQHPERVIGLTLIAPAGLGPGINGPFIDGFVTAERRRDAQEVLALLVHDPALVSRQMVEDVLRYKRLDGVPTALARIAKAWFPRRQSTVAIDPAAVAAPVQIIWGRDDRILPVAHAEALAGRLPVHIVENAGICRKWKRPARSTA